MNNGRFIKILNYTAASYSGIIYAGDTQVVPSDGGQLIPGISDYDSYPVIGVAAFFGLAAGSWLVDKILQGMGKRKRCLQLFARYLSGPMQDLFSSIFQGVFGMSLSELADGKGPKGADLVAKLHKLWKAWSSSNYMRTLNDAIDSLYGSDPSQVESIKSELRNCLTMLDGTIKDTLWELFKRPFRDVPEAIWDQVKAFWGKYLEDGDMFNFAVAIAAAAGTALVTSGLTSIAAQLFAQGFVEEFGIGYTAAVAVVSALLVVLGGFFALGGTAAGIVAWFASTAGSAISTAAAAAGITINPQVLARLQQIAQQIAESRQVAPAP